MYSFYEIKEMEKAKTRDILEAKRQYSKTKRNSAPDSEAVQERRGIIHYRDISIIQRFALLTKAFFEKMLNLQNKPVFSGGRS